MFINLACLGDYVLNFDLADMAKLGLLLSHVFGVAGSDANMVTLVRRDFYLSSFSYF